MVDVTVLHFANLRLGASFPSLGLRGRDHRAQLVTTLGGLADLAVAEQVNAVLITGDLFGCPVPAPATGKSVQAFITKLRDSGIPVILLQGSRDPRSLYDPRHQPPGQDFLGSATILNADQPIFTLKELDLTFQRVTLQTQGADHAFAPAAAATGGRLFGAAYFSGPAPLDLRAVAARFVGSPMSYLGIGGSPAFALHEEDSLIACSPGVPEPLEWGQEEGNVALVRIQDGVTRVTRAQTGTKSLAKRDLALTLDTARNVMSLVAAQAHDDLGLEVVLSGQCPGDILIDPAVVEMELAQDFFSLRVVDHTELVIDTSDQGDLPKGTVLGNFVRVMDERIRNAGDEDLRIHEREAYRLGMGLLQGGSA
jgi:DNA repair exonuclease SbcCD nuclease subunit